LPETDEALIEKFLDTGELSNDELKQGIRTGVVKHGLVPVLCGSAFKNKGVSWCSTLSSTTCQPPLMCLRFREFFPMARKLCVLQTTKLHSVPWPSK
jgi:hypothetical protein